MMNYKTISACRITIVTTTSMSKILTSFSKFTLYKSKEISDRVVITTNTHGSTIEVVEHLFTQCSSAFY